MCFSVENNIEGNSSDIAKNKFILNQCVIFVVVFRGKCLWFKEMDCECHSSAYCHSKLKRYISALKVVVITNFANKKPFV